jgi:hypothetical protein
VMSEEQLDAFLDDLLDSPYLQLTPPDLLVSVVYEWTGDNLEEVKTMARALGPRVVRAKGFVEEKGIMAIFNFVLGDWTIRTIDFPKERVQHKNVVVFIGPPDATDTIEAATRSGSWVHKGMYQPYAPT